MFSRVFMIAFVLTYRVGEALRPGPFVGAMNTTGLMGKGGTIDMLPDGVWCASETHLTGLGIQRFKQELSWNKSKFQLVHGHPAAPKNASLRTIGGKHTGVGMVSSYPSRTVQGCWSQDQYQTARCHVGASFVQGHWVHCGTVYGFSEAAHRIDVQQQTDNLLQGLTDRLVFGSHGPRVIAGDFNQLKQDLPQVEVWERAGWLDAQDLAQKLWNQPPQATCKQTTRKDYVFLSPEIQPFVRGVRIDWSFFPDHAVILVELANFGKHQSIPLWRKPGNIDYNCIKDINLQSLEAFQISTNENMDRQYRQVFEEFESRVNAAMLEKGHQGLLSSQKGRATTTAPKVVKQELAPIKPGRKGDITSQFAGTSLSHSRWTRQVRRLEHFARCVRSEKRSPDMCEHQANLWGRIWKASGFPEGFSSWYASVPHPFEYAPTFLPVNIPTEIEAFAILQVMTHEYRHLEKTLGEERRQQALARRLNDQNLIFQDVREESQAMVQTLVVDKAYVVSQVESTEETTKVHTQDELPQSIQEVWVGKTKCIPQQVEKSAVTISHQTEIQTGDNVTVSALTSDIHEMFKAFEDEWKPRWQRHCPDQNERWETIVNFAKQSLPKCNWTLPDITIDDWNKVLRAKRRKTAKGPDGVSREDLLLLPPDLTQHILCIIKQVENGKPWPSQMMIGLVSALAKSPTAQRVHQYRPITVLTLCYRVWASIRAKQCLKLLAEIVPFSLMGNIPKRSPKMMWFHIQACIEMAHHNRQEIAGSVIDIVKCFNLLPRFPLMQVAEHIGLPSCVIVPWKKALSQIHRKFSLRGGVSPGLESTTGYPEGCPLSVVAMAIGNVICEHWMKHRYPTVQTWSFVDNIETVCPSAVEAIESMDKLSQFCELMDLPVDSEKSYCWANDPIGRKIILQEEKKVVKFGRDLGGHMNYCKYLTNKTITEKIENLQLFWKRLSRACAPALLKERAICVAAWPRVFYSIAIAPIGPAHYEKLRTQVMRALNHKQHGANPLLQVSCICPPKCDPECFALLETITTFRQCSTVENAFPVLQALSDGAKVTPGPCSALLKSIFKLGWSWNPLGFINDAFGIPLQLMTCPVQELKERVILSWQHRVLNEVERTRETFDGLSKSDVRLTIGNTKVWKPDELGILKCALNGTIYTNDVLQYTSKVENDTCNFCNHQDCIEHRLFKCPFFEAERAQVPDWVWEKVQNLPPAFKLHGWLPFTDEALQLKILLCEQKSLTHEYLVHFNTFQQMESLDLFTDGSCTHPTKPDQRIATWSVVGWQANHFPTIGRGPVPGWHQTAQRGEITAAIAAIGFAMEVHKSVRIWSDNQQVVRFIRQWLSGRITEIHKLKDHDLWLVLADQLHSSRHLFITVHKVQSHVEPVGGCFDVDDWAFQGNKRADEEAEMARKDMNPAIWELWSRVVAKQESLTQVRDSWHKFMISVGLKAVKRKHLRTQVNPSMAQEVSRLEIDPAWHNMSIAESDEIPHHFRINEWKFLHEWMKQIASESGDVQWLSWHQLLVDYQLTSSRGGPRNINKYWYDSNREECIASYDYPRRVLWFGHFWQNMLKSWGQPLQYEKRRPFSASIAFWTPCIRISLSNWRLQRVEDFFKVNAKGLPLRSVQKHTHHFPVALV